MKMKTILKMNNAATVVAECVMISNAWVWNEPPHNMTRAKGDLEDLPSNATPSMIPINEL